MKSVSLFRFLRTLQARMHKVPHLRNKQLRSKNYCPLLQLIIIQSTGLGQDIPPQSICFIKGATIIISTVMKLVSRVFVETPATGACISVVGELIVSLGKGQSVEVKVNELEVLGDCDPEKYPLQLKNRPSLEYLREVAHLRSRTNTFSAVMRVRHAMAFAVHNFFNERGFFYIHPPYTDRMRKVHGDVSGDNFDRKPTREEQVEINSRGFFARENSLTVSDIEVNLRIALSDCRHSALLFAQKFKYNKASRYLDDLPRWLSTQSATQLGRILQYLSRYALKLCDELSSHKRLRREQTKPQDNEANSAWSTGFSCV